ncbi:MAG TPA: threonine/serine dehydratase [Gemmatimonadaceae bacterium]
MLDLDAVKQARQRIAGRVHVTPTMTSTMLGDRIGARLFLKCECFQKTGSFKARGALNRVDQLDAAGKTRGVITVSAGNHAQALAWASRAAGVRCTVVMPETASKTKVAASRGYGAEVVLYGASSIEAFARAEELAKERGLTFVHPFNDEQIAAGQGTAALELMEQAPDLDVVVVPVGGGGLISGIVTAVKGLRPRTRVVGVEPVGANVIRRSLDAGHVVRLEKIETIADGLAAPKAEEMTLDIIRKYVDDVVTISDNDIAAAMRDLLAFTKILSEPAGAAAVAALLTGAVKVPKGANVAAVVSGGNVDLDRLKSVL